MLISTNQRINLSPNQTPHLSLSLVMEILFTLESIEEAAKSFIKIIAGHTVIALHGEMGAGKTTFISRVVILLGSTGTPSSPTFSIINEYALPGKNKIFHIDLYRLKNELEAIEAGVEDCIYSEFVCFVEWPEVAPGILPNYTLHCYLDRVSEYERKLQINL